MTTHSPAFTAPQRQQQHGSPDLNSQRAAFLSGLRTGGPRSVSPRPSTDEPPSSLYSQDSLGRLKANAAVFKPSGPNSPPLGNARADQHANGLEEQLAALRMHALIAQNQANVTNYGTQYQDERAIAHARQQQQDQQQLQIQLTMMQLQAQHQQHQQQQHVAAQHQQQHQQQQQQQSMLAKLHAEYERQNQVNSPDSDGLHHMLGEYQQHASAQEQRQAAQASIQNSLRYRQAQAQQQIYQAILDGQQNGKQQRVDAQALLYQQQQQQHQQQQQQFQQQLLYAQLQAQAQAQAVQAQAMAQVPLEQRSWRSSVTHSRTQTPPSVRSGSPAAQGQGVTNGSAHKKAADSASSWRKTKTPSIVVDDSASDTQGSATDSETPETSEENAPSFNFKAPTNTEHSTSAGAGGRVHSLPPRAISIAAAPRNRAFAEQGPSRVASEGSSQTTIHPQRQPNGPPSDVKPTNFAARMSQRTRREALSKLNALVRSPRTVAAFSGTAAPAA